MEKMEVALVAAGAPSGVALFLHNEASKVYCNELPHNEVMGNATRARRAARSIEATVYDRELYPDCCESMSCIAMAVELVLLLGQLGEHKLADSVTKHFDVEQRNAGHKSCRGVEWHLGPGFAMAPASASIPRGYSDLVLPSQHEGAFWGPHEVPMAALLEAHAAEILREASPLFGPSLGETGVSSTFGHKNLNADLAADASSWNTLSLFQDGQWDAAGCALLPATCALLKTQPSLTSGGFVTTEEDEGKQVVKQLTFASVYRLTPPAHILRHVGNAWRLNVHLGLRCPEGARIRVWNEERSWSEGKAITFMDASEHEVFFQDLGGGDRLVLNVVVLHPEVVRHRSEDADFDALFVG